MKKVLTVLWQQYFSYNYKLLKGFENSFEKKKKRSQFVHIMCNKFSLISVYVGWQVNLFIILAFKFIHITVCINTGTQYKSNLH